MARLLIIEDCARIQRLLVRILGVYGDEVVVAANGHEGLLALNADACARAPFDVVVTEIFMPQRDGFEMIGAAIRLPRRPKILVVDHPFSPATVVGRPDYLRMASELGADCVLANPVRVRTLHAAVAALLNDRAPHPLAAPRGLRRGRYAAARALSAG